MGILSCSQRGESMKEFVSEPCYKCEKPTDGIYVRDKNGVGVWDSLPICDKCYDNMYPGRIPCKVMKE